MAEEVAVSQSEIQEHTKSPLEEQPEQIASVADAPAVPAKDQGEVDGKGEVAEEGEVDEAQPANEGPATGGLTSEEQLQKYKWYKCIADPAQYGPGHFYYTQTETGESSWTEPAEPYWIWDAQAGAVDSAAGLQIPGKPQASQQQLDDYQGYNPKIHGNYDPNASYARFHTRRTGPGAEYTNILDAAQQNASLTPDQTATAAADPYTSTMILNRFTGATQTGADLGPERHSDVAKSGRQMNAFFDVDAAANAHDGRSLKAERQAQKLTKQQVKEFNSKRAERKHKKRMQQLLS